MYNEDKNNDISMIPYTIDSVMAMVGNKFYWKAYLYIYIGFCIDLCCSL